MRCCSLMMLEKNERESTKLLCLYSQYPNWMIHFQELDTKLGTKFLQKGAGSFRDHLKGLCPRLQTDLKSMNFFKRIETKEASLLIQCHLFPLVDDFQLTNRMTLMNEWILMLRFYWTCDAIASYVGLTGLLSQGAPLMKDLFKSKES